MSETTDDVIIEWIDDFLSDMYCDEDHKDGYQHKVIITIDDSSDNSFTQHLKWHSANREWLEDKGFDYKFRADGTFGMDIEKIYYFKDKQEAMLFGLWCSRKL